MLGFPSIASFSVCMNFHTKQSKYQKAPSQFHRIRGKCHPLFLPHMAFLQIYLIHGTQRTSVSPQCSSVPGGFLCPLSPLGSLAPICGVSLTVPQLQQSWDKQEMGGEEHGMAEVPGQLWTGKLSRGCCRAAVSSLCELQEIFSCVHSEQVVPGPAENWTWKGRSLETSSLGSPPHSAPDLQCWGPDFNGTWTPKGAEGLL